MYALRCKMLSRGVQDYALSNGAHQAEQAFLGAPAGMLSGGAKDWLQDKALGLVPPVASAAGWVLSPGQAGAEGIIDYTDAASVDIASSIKTMQNMNESNIQKYNRECK